MDVLESKNTNEVLWDNASCIDFMDSRNVNQAS
jgi:hypothetical protein